MKKFIKDLEWIYAFFISFSIIGWIWEVIYKYYRYGVFINRGMNHLPWLPLYGWGSLVLLFIFLLMKEKKPLKVFLISATLSTVLEYFASYILEKAFGLRWWNYRFYFLNIRGRVCLQSFLLFGLLGLIGIYFLVPFIIRIVDRFEKKNTYKYFMPILIIIFMGDVSYSFARPNVGEHITYSTRVDNKEDIVVVNVYNEEEIFFKLKCDEGIILVNNYCKGRE